MARRNTSNTADKAPAPETTGDTAADGHMDFNDPETGAGHDAGGDDGLGESEQAGEPESHGDKHQDDGKPEPAEAPNRAATRDTLENGDGAEPEKEYDLDAAVEDTDNTHQDGGNGLHQEDYIDGDDAAELAKAEAEYHRAHDTGDDTSLHSGDIGRRLNMASETMVHSTLAPSNRDETIVGDHPEREKGLRPLAPIDPATRTDDAGRPYDGDNLHTVEKGIPPGQGVTEHVHAPTATGGIPEGIMSARAPVPVSGHQRDPGRFDKRQALIGDDHESAMVLTDTHHAMLDHAEDMKAKGADSFMLSQVGGTAATANALVDAGLLKAEKGMGGDFFPNGNRIYSLGY